MTGLHPAARIARLLEATPEELAVVDRALGLKSSVPLTATGSSGIPVVVAGVGPVVEQVVIVMGKGNRCVTVEGFSDDHQTTGPQITGQGDEAENGKQKAGISADGQTEILREMHLQRELLLGLHTQMEAVARNQYELRKENEELRQLNKEGYFNFAVRVNGEDFLAFAVIMALGNRKAAADHLELPHRSFYDRVNLWARGSKDQQRMFRLIEWRKKTGRKILVRLEDSVQSGEPNDEPENPVTVAAVLEGIAASDQRDYPAILREILEVLQMQNPKNWGAVREEVVGIIKEEV